MIETFIVAGVTAFFSACFGAFVTQAVMREKVTSLGKLVDTHADNFKRVIWRDECQLNQDKCSKNNDRRHEDLIKRMERLEDSLRGCFDDLIKELRKP